MSSDLQDELRQCSQLCDELKLIVELTCDQVTIFDENGILTKVYKNCDGYFGVSESELIGKSSYELEKIGVFSQSVTSLVLKEKKKVSIIQSTGGGKRLMVTGTPIWNDSGQLTRVINISRDVTQVENLNYQLLEMEKILEWYRDELRKRQTIKDTVVVGSSEEIQKITYLIQKVASTDITILLLGETGVGKSFFAKLIHQLSRQRDKNFIHVNCNAIPEALFESELFGYAEGAFTGAAKSGRKGLLELAQNGTIFLDEIGDLPLPIQIKLLNVLQEKSFYKIGSSVPVELKARIITATNKDLLKLVKEGKFREDLYYRLNVLPIQIPSLRSRSMDIQIIAKFFLDKFNTKYNAQKQLSSDAFLILGRYSWPGNIRELENLMERLVITSDSPTITAGDVVNILQVEENALLDATDTMPLKKAVEIFEKQLIRKALEKYKSTRKAAKALDIAQSTIVKKMKDNPG